MNEQTTTNTAAHDEPLAVLPPVDDDAAGLQDAKVRHCVLRHVRQHHCHLCALHHTQLRQGSRELAAHALQLAVAQLRLHGDP